MSSIYEKYDLKQVINASGRMTILGVSTPSADVVDTVSYGLNHYFEIKDLVNKTGAYIARLLEVENAVVVSCASAGIAQCIAAVIVKDNDWLLDNLHAAPLSVPHDIVVPKGHNVNYGAPVGNMVALGGGRLIEAGYSNECSPEQLAVVARKHGIPLIVDAAAEEDLQCYYQMGADLVIYSGAKAIEGPTSGLVIGRSQYVEWVKRQSNGIGRAMKVGKEGILGLTQAIENYLLQSKTSGADMVAKMTPFIDNLNTLNSVSARVVWDAAGRDIARAEIKFDEAVTGWPTGELVQALKNGDIAICFRGYKANEGIIEADVRSVSAEQLHIIFSRIQALLSGGKRA
ncbi:MAG: SelA-like pyridoxal phosphate-dependent enzyme [Pantoea sp. Pent]|nr:SelA-like pyridoxal phosphate-dependent enzyme [Pantoea sp. Pent]